MHKGLSTLEAKMIGTKLAHFEITAHLGSGGVGDVHQATDTKLGRNVAIKLLTESISRADFCLVSRIAGWFLLLEVFPTTTGCGWNAWRAIAPGLLSRWDVWKRFADGRLLYRY